MRQLIIIFHIWKIRLLGKQFRNNYEVEIISDDVCVLTQRKQKIEIEKLEKVGEQISSSNEAIVCPENADYVKIHLKLNLKGFIKNGYIM